MTWIWSLLRWLLFLLKHVWRSWICQNEVSEYILEKVLKMTKCWKTCSGSLKKMPTTNCVLKKMPAPYGGLVDWYFSYVIMSSDYLGSSWGGSYEPSKTMFQADWTRLRKLKCWKKWLMWPWENTCRNL